MFHGFATSHQAGLEGGILRPGSLQGQPLYPLPLEPADNQTLVAPGALYVGVGIIGGKFIILCSKLMTATVMPHALFLGSSLAGIDRLGMIPTPPTHDDNSKRSFKMPSLGLVRRLKGQPATDAREEETIEMERTSSTRLTDSPNLEDGTAREGDTDSKPDVLPPAPRKETEIEAAMRKYEAELKAFDRIRWTDLHISHATVSYSSPYLRL